MLRLALSTRYYIAGLIVLANCIVFMLYVLKGESQTFFKDSADVELRGLRSLGEIKEHQYDIVLSDHPGYIPPIIVYNRVPKTGSTTFANIAYTLAYRNHFNVLHINTTFRNLHWMNVVDQSRFVRNVSEWTDKQPAIYHGHIHFVDFTRFGYRNPIYINIVREPLERLVSYYYFLRYGDDYRPHLRRKYADDNTTFDKCVKLELSGCNPKQLWIQVPFFCGQNSACLKPSQWALERAKSNLLSHYLLVGVTDSLEEFIILLEEMLPSYFSGSHQLYAEGGLEHLRKTQGKLPPSEETIRLIQKSPIYKLELEFYEFAREQFKFLQTHAFQSQRGREKGLKISPAQFRYQKVAP